MAHIRLYTPADEEEVNSLQLRQADIDELTAATGLSPEECLQASLNNSEIAWVIVHKDKIAGVFGLCSTNEVGIPWLLATEALVEFKYAFLKYSWDVILVMLKRYAVLTNFVDLRHTHAIQWLQWLGFKPLPTEYFLHDKEVPFKQFVMYREEHHNV